MIRALPALLLTIPLAYACGSTGSPAVSRATSDSFAGLPSNACGGVHVKIVNETSGFMEVDVNGSWSTLVDAGASTVLVAGLTHPPLPAFPWSVVIADATGDETYRTTITGPVDQKITLTEASSTQAPYSLRDEGC